MIRNWQIILILLAACACKIKQEPPVYHSDIPLESPTLFSNEIQVRNGIAFSGDGTSLFASLQKADTFDNGRRAAGIFEYSFDNGSWSSPKPIEVVGLLDAYHPVISADDKRLFFNSRSHPDSAGAYLLHDIWYVERSNDQWSSPTNVSTINTEYYESYPSVAANGNLYFNSNRPGGKGGMDLYMSAYKNGKYSPPIWLANLSSEHEENDVTIDPQERFIILNRYIHSDQSLDLWISFNQEGDWTVPRRLDTINQADVWELTPTISPDGKYFFYEIDQQIWQVDLAYLIYPKELAFGKLTDR